jgi:hypothetical protein
MTVSTPFGGRWVVGFLLFVGISLVYVVLVFRLFFKQDAEFLPFFAMAFIAPSLGIGLVQYFTAVRAKLEPFIVWSRVAVSALGAPLLAFVLLLAACNGQSCESPNR